MSKIKLVAIDLAKRCYQMGAIDEHCKVLYNRKLTPAEFALAIQQLEPTIIAMEACSAALYWGRRLIALGHEVRLVPPQHAKAFRRVHKSDANDTISIAEAALRPNIHFVPVRDDCTTRSATTRSCSRALDLAAHRDHQPDTRARPRVRRELRKEPRGTTGTTSRRASRCAQRSVTHCSRRTGRASSRCSACD